MSTAPGSPRFEEHRPGAVQECEHPLRAIGGDQVEVGHPASEQRMALAEVVVDAQAGHLRRESFARLVHRQELANGVARGRRSFVVPAQRDRRHRRVEHARSDGMALGLVGVEEAVRRCPLDHLGQLPAQVHRILHAGLEALAAVRRVHVRRVAGQEDPSVAVRRGLARRRP